MDGVETKRSYRRLLYWGLAIVSLFMPVIIKLMFFESFKWSISLLFPFVVFAIYPAWRFGLAALAFVNVFEYLVEYFLFRNDFHDDLLPLLVNSVLNCFLFVMVGSFILHYHNMTKRLGESGERYRKLLEFSPTGIIVHRDDLILYANPSALQLVKDADMVGKSVFSYVHPDEREMVEKRFSQFRLGIPLPTAELKLIRATGEVVVVEAWSVFIQYGGLPATLAVLNDITDRKLTERALAESERRYRRLVELSPIAMLVHYDGHVQYVNHACVKLLGGSSAEQLIGKPILGFSAPEYQDLVEKRIRELNRTGILVKPMEEKVIRLDRKIIDVEVAGISITYEGKPSYLMMIRDITAEKQAEETVRKSEEKYRLIAENMTDLIGILEVNGVVRYASPSHEHVLGFSPEVYEGHLAFDMVYPDDVQYVQSKFMEMVMAKENKIIEFRYKHINGNGVWVEAKATPILDKDRNVLYFQVVARDISERKAYEEKLVYMAFHDALTGLPNRRLFKDRFKQASKEAKRYGRKMAVMYMDVDRFKSINDKFGHDVGDELLKQFARRVQECLRESDILARQGGDEFIVLLSEIENEQDAVGVAHRMLASIQKPWEIRGYVFETTSSIGIAFYPRDGTTVHELLEHADGAMYQAKENGRNTVESYYGLDKRKH